MATRKRRPAKRETVLPELTPEQLALSKSLKAIQSAIGVLQQQYQAEHEKCVNHAIAYTVDGHAWCEICEADFGWHCPKSPDHACHYFSERVAPGMEPYVQLNNGQIAYLSIDHYENQEYETDDCCLFCHDPYERK